MSYTGFRPRNPCEPLIIPPNPDLDFAHYALDHLYNLEVKRRRKSKMHDENIEKARDQKIDANGPEYNIADRDVEIPWQKTYSDTMGGIKYRLDSGYTCPKCGCYHQLGIAGGIGGCIRCKHPMPVDLMFREGIFKR